MYTHRNHLKYLPTLVSLILLLLGAPGARADGPSKRERSALATAEKRLALIREEIAQMTSPHPWAGDYHRGATQGTIERLALAPGSGFVSITSDCTGLVACMYGRAYERGDRIVVVIDGTSDERSEAKPSTQLLVVGWGERRYLLRDDEVLDFCNAVNAGFEPAPHPALGSRFLVRADGLAKSVSGRPHVPPEYVPYLPEQPIRAAIVVAGPARTEPAPYGEKLERVTADVTLGAGRAEGLLPGMELRGIGAARGASVVVGQVSEHTSTAVFTSSGRAAGPAPGPEVGWSFSTSGTHDGEAGASGAISRGAKPMA